MIFTKYNVDIKKDIVQGDLKKIINQIYKLLPMREEKAEWQKPLETLMVQLTGMSRLLEGQQEVFLPLLCKLEGLFTLTEEKDFQLYRRTIFECLSLLNEIKQNVT